MRIGLKYQFNLIFCNHMLIYLITNNFFLKDIEFFEFFFAKLVFKGIFIIWLIKDMGVTLRVEG